MLKFIQSTAEVTGVHTLPKGILKKVIVIARQELELFTTISQSSTFATRPRNLTLLLNGMKSL